MGQVGAVRIEDDHALFAGVGHKNAPGLVHGDPAGTPEAIRQTIDFEDAPHPQELPIWCENLDTMIPRVGDVDIPIGTNCDAPGFVHETSGDVSIHHVAIATKGIEEQALRVEVHDTMIARIRNKQAAIRGNGNIPGSIKGGFTRKIDHAQWFEADGVASIRIHTRRFRLRADAIFPDHGRDIFFDIHACGVAGRPGGEGQRGVVEGSRVLRVVAIEPKLPDGRAFGRIFQIPQDARERPIAVKRFVWPPHALVVIAIVFITHHRFDFGKVR